ncbi:MAG: cell division protein FtsW [Candidatus Melainabacteria bacterium]|nr:cell division protein FtsW [Candidatus Melainabacteria bacterium]
MRKGERFLKNWFLDFNFFKSIDLFFIQLTLALTVLGLIFAFLSSTYESNRLTNSFWSLGLKQLIAFILGFILLLLFQKLHYKFWYKTTWLIAFTVLFIMLVTVFSPLGKVSGGSQRWIDLGIIQFQPAEIAKFTVILLLTRFLTKYKWFEFKSYYYLIFIFGLILIILKQPDLGSATILFLLFMELSFLFGWPLWILFLFSLLTGLIGYLKIYNTPYQLERIQYWQDPYLDPQGKGYNLIQAMYALALGNFWGVGLGNSIQKQGHLPIPHSDFIFAVIAEEVGFLGVSAILILFITWILRGLYLVNKVENKYGKMLGSAIIFLIGTQATVNIAVAVGLLPVTGVTLPFFSCGGTSLIVTLAMCGILFNIISTANLEATNNK